MLGLIMFAMGLGLRPENFLEVSRRPRVILLGIVLQYTIMPVLAWVLSICFGLPASLMLGRIQPRGYRLQRHLLPGQG